MPDQTFRRLDGKVEPLDRELIAETVRDKQFLDRENPHGATWTWALRGALLRLRDGRVLHRPANLRLHKGVPVAHEIDAARLAEFEERLAQAERDEAAVAQRAGKEEGIA